MNSLNPWQTIVTDPYGGVIWPRAYYNHPFYSEIPSWIHYGNDDSTTRRLFDGAFVGADGANMIGAELTALSAPYGYGYPLFRPFRPYLGADAPPAATKRTGLTADLAPIMAPATGGITVKKELDDKQVLRVEICVDGKCYRTSMDLAPAITMVMEKLARWHQGQHAQMPAPSTVVSTVENAVRAAGDEIVGVMVGNHVAVMTSGWFDDVRSAIGGTLRKLQPVIAVVATTAATAAGGPAAGAAAAKIVPMWTDLQANVVDPKGDPKKKAQAKQAIQQIHQQAAADPALAQALDIAHQAVKHTTVAYHVKETAQKAAAGDRTAQKDISNLVKAAEQGDPAAKSTFEVLASTFGQELMQSEAGAKLWEKVTGRGPATVSGWYDIVGGWYDIVGAAMMS